MTLSAQRSNTSTPRALPADGEAVLPGAPPRAERAALQPWAAALAVATAIAGAALGLNGVLRGWAWYSPVFSTVLAVAFAQAALRALRLRPVLVASGGVATLILVLTFIFFRKHSLAGFIPASDTMAELGKFLRRASETVLAESSPVAPNAGIVMVICAVLGLMVILVDTLAFPLSLPATSGLGILAVLVVPAMIKAQSVGTLGFAGAAVGYLLILGCSQWFCPDRPVRAVTARSPGHLGRATVTGAMALGLSLLLPLAIPGFDRGTFPEGSRLNLLGTAGGLNPMISLGDDLRSSSGGGRITYATNAPAAPYLRTVTVENFDGDAWAPDDRQSTRRFGTRKIGSGLNPATTGLRVFTAVDAGQFTSPYLPAPYAPESVNGLTGRWSWDPDTLSIKGVGSNSYNQQYLVVSVTAELTPELLAQSSASPKGVPDQFTRRPADVPEIVLQTAASVTAAAATAYGKAMALQRYLRSGEFSYSLQSPVQGGYDSNGMSVLADFLVQKSGYCIHFASAMAVMARLQGIPSRIAVGFAPGRPTGATMAVPGQGSLPEYEVDSRDAHAWPELYFEGLGWVAFEPTPSRGVVPAYAAENAPAGSARPNDAGTGLVPLERTAPAPAPGATPAPPPVVDARGSAGSGLAPALYPAGALLLLVLMAGWPRLARARRQRRRVGKPGGHAPAARLAWLELRDLATDYGVPPRIGETPRNFSVRLRGTAVLGEPDGAGAAGHQAVAQLTEDFEREEYGRPGSAGAATGPASVGPASVGLASGAAGGSGTGSAAARIALVRAALAARAGPWVRFRAAWLPQSVLSAWRCAGRSGFQNVRAAVRRTRRGAADGWRRVRGAVGGGRRS